MSVSITVSGSTAQIHLSGYFDFSKQDDLSRALEEAFERSTGEIEIDFSEVKFIDSSVLRLLIKMYDKARQANRPLALSHCNERILEIFRVGGFDRLFTIR